MALSGNELTIAQFLLNKGLNPPEVAGILGNLEVESGFNPGASNANEGAIGIAQWEGGRRTNLNNFARSQGLAETDINAQLGYLWQELTGSYATSVYTPLKTLNDAAAVAALWDAKFEVSSGSARQQREKDATDILAQMTGLVGTPTTGADGNTFQKGNGFADAGNASSGQNVVINNAAFTATNTNVGTGPTGTSGTQDANWFVNLLEATSPLKYLSAAGSVITDAKDAITALANVVGFIAEAFQKFLWLFAPGHFVKFLLYVGGVMAVMAGMWFLIKGSGEDRPA